mmetsp:Transcript_1811/g.4157  ORF Transcript_1811/g.4157 Transcript_1811/m.4157 type:complete len:246 (+) Transcript_1811:37-774(+)
MDSHLEQLLARVVHELVRESDGMSVDDIYGSLWTFFEKEQPSMNAWSFKGNIRQFLGKYPDLFEIEEDLGSVWVIAREHSLDLGAKEADEEEDEEPSTEDVQSDCEDSGSETEERSATNRDGESSEAILARALGDIVRQSGGRTTLSGLYAHFCHHIGEDPLSGSVAAPRLVHFLAKFPREFRIVPNCYKHSDPWIETLKGPPEASCAYSGVMAPKAWVASTPAGYHTTMNSQWPGYGSWGVRGC